MNRYLFFSKTTLGELFYGEKKTQSMSLKTVISKTGIYQRREGAYSCISVHNMIEERSQGVRPPLTPR